VTRTPPLPLLLVALLLLAGCGSGGAAKDGSGTSADRCSYHKDGSDPAKKVDLPPSTPPTGNPTSLTISTSAGDIPVTLEAAQAPCAVNSFVSLADQGYFDGTTCHRLTTQGIYVLQCGDPTASGAGGPGYSFEDELSGKETYEAGTLAMANAGPDTNGSQFFIVYEDSQLPPSYAVFGHVDDAGLKVVREIAEKGTKTGAPDGPPKEPVEIDSVTAE
jgi:peptidyl-prolyl cis-trans isomerase B (cyclophilin B)